MCRAIDEIKPKTNVAKNILFTVVSVGLGIFAQHHKQQITGPFFEPILSACMESHDSMADFVAKTGYQPYEPAAGLGIFAPMVCLVTQFMFQLRNTYPEGILTWGLAVVGVFPYMVIAIIEGGRAGAKGPIRWPVIMGIVHQLLGMSVSIPLIWVPAYIWGKGQGPVSVTRLYASVPMVLPIVVLPALVFSVDTESYLWMLAAGITGGPALALIGSILWFDAAPSVDSKEGMQKYIRASVKAYQVMTVLSLAGWAGLVSFAYRNYGMDLATLWRAIFSEADPGVAFLTLDYILIYVGLIFGYVAYQSWSSAIQTLVLLPVLGPASLSLAMEKFERAYLESSIEKTKQL